MKHTRAKKRTRRTRQRGRGTNVANFAFVNPLQRLASIMPLAAVTRIPITESAPLFVSRGKATANTRRRSLKNNAASQQYVGINMNAASAANTNTVRTYTGPGQREVAETIRTPSPIRPISVGRMGPVPAALESRISFPPTQGRKTAWSTLRAQQTTGSRHLQI